MQDLDGNAARADQLQYGWLGAVALMQTASSFSWVSHLVIPVLCNPYEVEPEDSSTVLGAILLCCTQIQLVPRGNS